VDVAQRPIRGLYAAGEIVGGLFHNNYPGGSGLTSGTVSGRRAGPARRARRTHEGAVVSIVAPWFRLGYIIPTYTQTSTPTSSHRVAPDGMMLVTTQLNLADYTVAAVEAELPTFWERPSCSAITPWT